MNVKELIEQLQKLNPEQDVIIQKDGEGNGYSPLSDVEWDLRYHPETTWSGEVYQDEDLDELGWDEEDRSKLQNVVVLVPVN